MFVLFTLNCAVYYYYCCCELGDPPSWDISLLPYLGGSHHILGGDPVTRSSLLVDIQHTRSSWIFISFWDTHDPHGKYVNNTRRRRDTVVQCKLEQEAGSTTPCRTRQVLHNILIQLLLFVALQIHTSYYVERRKTENNTHHLLRMPPAVDTTGPTKKMPNCSSRCNPT